MTVELGHSFLNLEANVDEECIDDLVDYVGQYEVEGVAEGRSILARDVFVPKLVNRKPQKSGACNVHHMAHQLSNLLVFMQEISRFFSVKVADLKQDYTLNEARTNEYSIVDRTVLNIEGVPDED